MHHFYSYISFVAEPATIKSDQPISPATSLLPDEKTVLTASEETAQIKVSSIKKSPSATHKTDTSSIITPSALFVLSSGLSKKQTTSLATRDRFDTSVTTNSNSDYSPAKRMPGNVARLDFTSTTFRSLSLKQTIKTTHSLSRIFSSKATYAAKTQLIVSSVARTITQALSLVQSQSNCPNNSTILFTSTRRNKTQNEKSGVSVHRSKTAVYVILIGMPIASFILIPTCVYYCVVKPKKPREIAPAEPGN